MNKKISITPSDAEEVFKHADLIHSHEAIEQAYDKMAAEITEKLGDKNLLVICVMQGGLIPTGMLLPRLKFPLRVDYIHASRYNGKTRGGELHWVVKPHEDITNRVILLVDDIHDEGLTLDAIVKSCIEDGASEVYTAVLVNKIHNRKNNTTADFVGIDVEDRYLFGYGMDYKGYLRNAAGIYAVREEDET